MAIVKAVVLSATGELQELQPGDILSGPVAEVDVVQVTNNNGSAITVGQAVYLDGAGSVSLAQANAVGTATTLGLVFDASIADAASGSVQTNGAITSTDWTAVIGAVTLTPNSIYYLSNATAGQLTATAPVGNPNLVVRVGQAIDTTTLQIRIRQPIQRG